MLHGTNLNIYLVHGIGSSSGGDTSAMAVEGWHWMGPWGHFGCVGSDEMGQGQEGLGRGGKESVVVVLLKLFMCIKINFTQLQSKVDIYMYKYDSNHNSLQMYIYIYQ